MHFRQAIEPCPLVSLGDQSTISAFPGDQPAGFDFGIRRGHTDAIALAKCLDGNRALGDIVLHLPSFLSRPPTSGVRILVQLVLWLRPRWHPTSPGIELHSSTVRTPTTDHTTWLFGGACT